MVSSFVRELAAGRPSSIKLQTNGKPMTFTTFTKAMIDAILPIVTPQNAIDLQVATNISERQSFVLKAHI